MFLNRASIGAEDDFSTTEVEKLTSLIADRRMKARTIEVRALVDTIDGARDRGKHISYNFSQSLSDIKLLSSREEVLERKSKSSTNNVSSTLK